MGLFMAIIFFASRKRYTPHVQNITVILLILSLLLFFEIVEETNLVDSYPFLLGISPVIDLLIWPFLISYIEFICGVRRKNWRIILYFLPLLIAIAWQIPFLVLSDASKLSFFSEGIPQSIFGLVTFKLIFTVGFLIILISTLSTSMSRYKAFIHNNKKIRLLNATRKLIWALSFIITLIYGLFYISYFKLLNLGDSDRIGSLIVSLLIYLLGSLIFNYQHLFLRKSYHKQIVNSFNGQESKYIERLLGLFELEKIYLNESLTSGDIADKVELSEQQLSYLINGQLGISISDFIATYRVNEIQNRISKGDHRSMTLLGLAHEAGYNSKATFNRNFKEHTGLTPSEYVDQLK